MFSDVMPKFVDFYTFTLDLKTVVIRLFCTVFLWKTVSVAVYCLSHDSYDLNVEITSSGNFTYWPKAQFYFYLYFKQL